MSQGHTSPSTSPAGQPKQDEQGGTKTTTTTETSTPDTKPQAPQSDSPNKGHDAPAPNATREPKVG